MKLKAIKFVFLIVFCFKIICEIQIQPRFVYCAYGGYFKGIKIFYDNFINFDTFQQIQDSNFNNSDNNQEVVGVQFICSRDEIIIEGLGKKDENFVFGIETNFSESRVCNEPEDAVNWIIYSNGDYFPVCYPYQKNRQNFVQDKNFLYVVPKNFQQNFSNGQLWQHWQSQSGSRTDCAILSYNNKYESLYTCLYVVAVAFHYNNSKQQQHQQIFENRLIGFSAQYCKLIFFRDVEIMEGCGGPLNENITLQNINNDNNSMYENDPYGVDNNERNFECIESDGWRDAQCQGFENDYCKWVRNLDSNETWYTCNLATIRGCENVLDCKDPYPPKYAYNAQHVQNISLQCQDFDEFEFAQWYQVLSKNDPKKCLTTISEESSFYTKFQNCSDLRFDFSQRFRVNYVPKEFINEVEIESGKLPGWCLVNPNNINNSSNNDTNNENKVFSLYLCNQSSVIFSELEQQQEIQNLQFDQFSLNYLPYETWTSEIEIMKDFLSGFQESFSKMDPTKQRKFWDLQYFQQQMLQIWDAIQNLEPQIKDPNNRLQNVVTLTRPSLCDDRQIWCNKIDQRIVAIDADFSGEFNLQGNLEEHFFNVFKLPKLNSLNLQNSNLQGNLAYQKNLPQESLEKISRLKYLNLANNNISGFLPFDWGANNFFQNLEILDLSNNSELKGIFPKTWNYQNFNNNNFFGSLNNTKVCFNEKNPQNWEVSKQCDLFEESNLQNYKFSISITGKKNQCVNCEYFENSKFINISDPIFYFLGDIMKFSENKHDNVLNCKILQNGPCPNNYQNSKRKLLQENQQQSRIQFEFETTGIQNQQNETKNRLENNLPLIYDEIASVKTDEIQSKNSSDLTGGEMAAISLSTFIVVFVVIFLFIYFFLIPKILKPYFKKRNAKKALEDIPQIIKQIDHEIQEDDIKSLIEQIDKRWGKTTHTNSSSQDENQQPNGSSFIFNQKFIGNNSSEILVSLDQNEISGLICVSMLPRQTFFSLEENVTLNDLQKQRDYEELKELFQVPRSIVPNSENQLIITQQTPFSYDIDLEIDIERDIQLEHELGRGGFGIVFKGTWTNFKTGLKKEVAVKFLQQGMLQEVPGKSMLKNFKEELALMGRINHPNIVKCYGGSLKPDNLAIVMEFMHGGNLGDYIHEIHRNQKMRETEILRIVAHIAAGLNYLHPSILHRDLKPQNVLLDAYGVPKISDFGVSKLRQNTATMTNNKVIGTPQYIAPEVWIGNGGINEKSDIYSLGIIAWEMLTGERPWSQCYTYLQILALVSIFKKRPVIPQNCSSQLTELIQDCWEEDPKRRPAANTIHRNILWHLQRQGS